MDFDNFIRFLIEAKKNGYAGSNANVEVLDDGGKKVEFSEGSFKYRDTWRGFNPFFGEEIVWEENKEIFIMNYDGRVIKDKDEIEETYAFLKKALERATPQFPFRGLPKFREGDLEYNLRQYGNRMGFFSGRESINRGKKTIYRGVFRGTIVPKVN